MIHSLETFVIGDSDAVMAEYGAFVEKPFALLTLYNGEVQDAFGFNTKAEALEELSWVEARNTITYL